MHGKTWWKFLILLVFFLLGRPAEAQTSQPLVILLSFDGAVAPPLQEYLQRGIDLAESQNAELLILQLNTPGGTVDALNHVIQTVRGSRVPVVVYVAPRGAMAGSAGAVVVLAGHAAAMAPETAIGAASPVGGQGEDLNQTEQEKVKNILKATVRSLAKNRNPEAIALAEQTIEAAQAVSADEALEIGLIDFIATDVNDLLQQLDGYQVQVGSEELTLKTEDAQVTPFNQSFIEKLLSILTNPTIVFLFVTLGVQAILIEFSSPGGWVAGTLGVVFLALAAYGFGVLPVNWFGMVFFILAFVLFILDIKAPTHGALTVAGTIALIAGSLITFNSPTVPMSMHVPPALIITTSTITGLTFFVIMLFAVRAQKTPVRMGPESLVGRIGTAREDIVLSGQVQLGGEQWMAELQESEPRIVKGERVEVVGIKGLRLIIRRLPR